MSKPANQEVLIAKMLSALQSSTVYRMGFGFVVVRKEADLVTESEPPRRYRRTKAEMQMAQKEMAPVR